MKRKSFTVIISFTTMLYKDFLQTINFTRLFMTDAFKDLFLLILVIYNDVICKCPMPAFCFVLHITL